MSIKSGKLATGTSRAPMTIEQVKDAVRPNDTAITAPISVAAGYTLIVPNAEVGAAVTCSSVATYYGIYIGPGGSITFNPANGKLAT